eukprot:3326520-Pyramimonas_sp.AAC.1
MRRRTRRVALHQVAVAEIETARRRASETSSSSARAQAWRCSSTSRPVSWSRRLARRPRHLGDLGAGRGMGADECEAIRLQESRHI